MRMEQDGDMADILEIVLRHLMRHKVIYASVFDGLKGVLNKLINNSSDDWVSVPEMLMLFCFHFIIKDRR